MHYAEVSSATTRAEVMLADIADSAHFTLLNVLRLVDLIQLENDFIFDLLFRCYFGDSSMRILHENSHGLILLNTD